MLARILYAAVALSVLGAFPKGAVDRAQRAARAASPTAAAAAPALRPRAAPERYCQAEGALDIERTADFANPRIDR